MRLRGLACVAAVVSLFVWQPVAAACACCDGTVGRTVLGWSDRGVRVGVSRMAGCSIHKFEEVWRRGQDAPVHCFDRQAETPQRAVPCDRVRDGDYGDPVAATGREAFFPQPVRWVEASRIDVVWRAVEDDDDDVPGNADVEVRYWNGTEWTVVARLHVVLLRGENDEGDTEPEFIEEARAPTANEALAYYGLTTLTARIALAPSGDHGLLLLTGTDQDPGIGLFGDEPHMVELTGPPPPSVEEPVPVYGVVRPSPQSDAWRERIRVQVREAAASDDIYLRPIAALPPPEDVARHLVRQGLRDHRARRYGAALASFLQALQLQPAYAAARFDAACAYARLGRLEQAMVRLRELAEDAEAGCTDCRARLRAAATDADLAPLRTRTDFRALTQR